MYEARAVDKVLGEQIYELEELMICLARVKRRFYAWEELRLVEVGH